MGPNTRILDRIIEGGLIGFVVFSPFSISLTQISFTLGGLAWLAKVQLTHSWRQVKLPLGPAFLFFVLASVLAVITAVDISLSYESLKKLLQIIIFFWVVNALRDEEHRETLITILMVTASMAALYGLYQAFSAGVSLHTRPEGTMSIYMTFAGMLMLVALMALSRFLFRSPRELWTGCAVILLSVCLILTLTRQAWLGFLTGLLFLVFIRQKKLLLALPVVLGLMVLFSSGSVKERILSMTNFKDATFVTRLELWQGGWEIFKDYPLTGCGFKCVDTVFSQYPEHTSILEKYRGLHSNIVQIAVDTGIVGLSAWILIWVCYFFTLYKQSAAAGAKSRWIVLGSAAAVLGFLAAGMFEVNFYDSEVAMLMYFLMALPFAASGKESKPEAST